MLPTESNDINPTHLARARVLARNSIGNVTWHTVLLVKVFFAIPSLIKSLGTERFSVFILIWMTVVIFVTLIWGSENRERIEKLKKFGGFRALSH